jgi:hypothetical protein
MKRLYDVRAKRLLWHAPSLTTTGGRGATARLAMLPWVWSSARNSSAAARLGSNSSIARSSKRSNSVVRTLARVKDRVVLSVSQGTVERFSNRGVIQLAQDAEHRAGEALKRAREGTPGQKTLGRPRLEPHWLAGGLVAKRAGVS